jgi:hypothetical protein
MSQNNGTAEAKNPPPATSQQVGTRSSLSNVSKRNAEPVVTVDALRDEKGAKTSSPPEKRLKSASDLPVVATAAPSVSSNQSISTLDPPFPEAATPSTTDDATGTSSLDRFARSITNDSNHASHFTNSSPFESIPKVATTATTNTTATTTRPVAHSDSVCSDLSSAASGGATTPVDGFASPYPSEKQHESYSLPITSATAAGAAATAASATAAEGTAALTDYYAEPDDGQDSERSLSPNPRFRVPPAPPSTPASLRSSNSSLGLSFSFDGLADFVGPPTLTATTPHSISTPIAPMMVGGTYVRSADLLEQQMLLDGGVTPGVASMPPSHRTSASSGNHGTAALLAADMMATPAAATLTAADVATPKPPPTAAASAATAAPTVLPDDFSNWAVGDRYQLIRILGRGSYGEVAQAIDVTKSSLHGGEAHYVAIKRIQSPFEQQLDAVRLYREIHILRRMKQGGEDPPSIPSDDTTTDSVSLHAKRENRHHDCIIQLLDVVQPSGIDDFNDLYLVFECKF